MSLVDVHIKGVRNIDTAQLKPSGGLNIIIGPNGSGKTSILESLYLLSRARSFRTHNIKKVINKSQLHLMVYAQLSEQAVQHKLAVKKDSSSTIIRVDGKSQKKSSELSRLFYAHLIRPESQTLLENGSAPRRSFVDWGVFHVKHEFIETHKRFNQFLKQRNKLLKLKQLDTLDSWDNKLSEYGILLSNEREKYIQKLEASLKEITGLVMNETGFSIRYLKGWEKETSLYEALRKTKVRDTQFGYTTVGPQKSDFRIILNKLPVQDYLSRGQMKLLVISLYLAQVKIMSELSTKSVCVLVDDLAAELDAESFKKIMLFLINMNTQVFLTTTNKDLFLEYIEENDSKVFHVKHGKIEQEEH